MSKGFESTFLQKEKIYKWWWWRGGPLNPSLSREDPQVKAVSPLSVWAPLPDQLPVETGLWLPLVLPVQPSLEVVGSWRPHHMPSGPGPGVAPGPAGVSAPSACPVPRREAKASLSARAQVMAPPGRRLPVASHLAHTRSSRLPGRATGAAGAPASGSHGALPPPPPPSPGSSSSLGPYSFICGMGVMLLPLQPSGGAKEIAGAKCSECNGSTVKGRPLPLLLHLDSSPLGHVGAVLLWTSDVAALLQLLL